MASITRLPLGTSICVSQPVHCGVRRVRRPVLMANQLMPNATRGHRSEPRQWTGGTATIHLSPNRELCPLPWHQSSILRSCLTEFRAHQQHDADAGSDLDHLGFRSSGTSFAPLDPCLWSFVNYCLITLAGVGNCRHLTAYPSSCFDFATAHIGTR